jgi:hypothetical protein
MRKIRFLAVAMAIVILMPMLMSCSSGKKSSNVVKADDPWYETTRFKLEKNLKPYSMEGGTQIASSDDKIITVYCYSNDMWGSSITIIDVYDFDGNRVNHKAVEYPEGIYFTSVYSMTVDPEGKQINAIVHYGSGVVQPDFAFITIDAETGAVTNLKPFFTDEVKKLSKSGGVFNIFYLGEYAVALLDSNYTGGMQNWQILLFKDDEVVTGLDLSTLSVSYFDGFSIDKNTDTLYAVGYEKGELITMEFDINNGQLKGKNSFENTGDDSFNIAEYSATSDGDLVKIDSLGNIMKVDLDTMTPQTVIDTNWYTPYFLSSSTTEDPFVFDSSFSSGVLSCNEDRAIILDMEYISYGFDESESNLYLRVLKKADTNPHAGKEIIELALPPNQGVSVYLAEAIYEFNKTDNEYLIRVWDKYKSGFVIGRISTTASEDDQKVYEMIQDLKGDDAPDIAIGIQKNYAMRDDVFMDLSDFLEPEVLEKQFTNIIEAGRIDGKLYFLPVTLEIEGLVTNVDLLEQGAVGITFEDFDKLINEDMDGFSPYDYPGATVYNRRTFFLSCIDTKSAIEGETIDFGTEQFRAAAEYARDNFEFADETEITSEYRYDFSRYRGECYYTKIDDYLDYVHACNKEKNSYRIIGTPSVDATGPRFKALETISVSATTDVEGGCRKFLNYLFSGSHLYNDDYTFRQIVTNKEIMSKDIENLTVVNDEAYDRYLGSVQSGAFRPVTGLDKATGDKHSTEDMRESFLESLGSISIYYYEDYTIVQFTLEELAPYYAGDRTLDDVIMYLNDRTTKYIREM